MTEKEKNRLDKLNELLALALHESTPEHEARSAAMAAAKLAQELDTVSMIRKLYRIVVSFIGWLRDNRAVLAARGIRVPPLPKASELPEI